MKFTIFEILTSIQKMGCLKLTYNQNNDTLKVAYSLYRENQKYCTGSYRYGFNGKEKDDDIKNIEGSSYDFGARIYDPRIGRWLSLDPLASKYPMYSPYNFVTNSPLQYIDLDGRDYDYSVTMIKNKDGSMTKVVNINVVYNVVNVSSKEVNSGDFNKAANVLSKNLDYNSSDAELLKGVKNVEVNINVSFNIVTDYSKINDNENILFVVDKAKNTENSEVVGWGTTPGNTALVEAGYIDYNNLNKFAALVEHEVGHNLGLPHNENEPNSVMHPSTNSKTGVSSKDQKNFDVINNPSFFKGNGHLGSGNAKAKGADFLKNQATSYDKSKANKLKIPK